MLKYYLGLTHSMSPLVFYAYHLLQRLHHYKTILRGGRLFQQYVVDQYCNVGAERLKFLRCNQDALRAADYRSLTKQLRDPRNTGDKTNVVRAGRMFILLPTYVGGDQYVRQNMHNFIAISNNVNYPDAFLTMTCKPRRPKINNVLLPGQAVTDHPDLTARVFWIKLHALMAFVINERVFGEVKIHFSVIEFQKRCLPYSHCIFCMAPQSKTVLLQPSFIDSINSTEISPNTISSLRQDVLKHNMHSVCGVFNPSFVCMDDGIKTKQFSKQFMVETGCSDAKLHIT